MVRCRKKQLQASCRGCLCPADCCDCCPRDPCGEPDPCAPPPRPCGLLATLLAMLWPSSCGGGGGGQQFDDADSSCDDGEARAGRIACALAELKRCLMPPAGPSRLLVGFIVTRALLWFFDIDVFIVTI